MADIIDFPDKISGAPKISVTLSGTQWLAVMLKLAGRNLSATARAELEEAEASMMRQLKLEG